MSFESSHRSCSNARFFANVNDTNMPPGAISQPFSSPGLSLRLQTSIDGQCGKTGLIGADFEVAGGRGKEEEYESRSGSDGGSGDDQDADNRPRKKRHHRHSPQQIQELEAVFKECPHPDEKRRMELSARLGLEGRQVKFWFQNRRTQMKTQHERHENLILKQENDKLRAENMSIRDAMRNPVCSNCGQLAMLGSSISLEGQQLLVENAHLKDELNRVCALATKFLGRPASSPLSVSSLELSVGNNGLGGLNAMPATSPLGSDFGSGVPSVVAGASAGEPSNVIELERSLERSVFLELAVAAMDELVKMVQTNEPLWLLGVEGGNERLNFNEYQHTFVRCIAAKPIGFVTEATRKTGMIAINSSILVETLMDADRWAAMFPCMIARTSTLDVISNGMGGTRNGALQLMHEELQVLSPLVPIREINFLRFCKQHLEGVWAVVDVSIDGIREDPNASACMNCRKLPSGCIVQDMPNGYSKVTWVEHVEYDESTIHQLYRPFIRSGLGFGAHRWVANLQRHYESVATLMISTVPASDHNVITPSGRRGMLKLAQRMVRSFCAGVCASTVYKWSKLEACHVEDDVRLMTRKSVDEPGEPPGVVLSAATSVWLPVLPDRLFDFVRDERLRSEWDILSNGGPMQEVARISKGQKLQGHSSYVSLLSSSAMTGSQSSMLIVQETCTDPSGSLVVYAPVDIPALHAVISGGDSANVALLPSGFVIVPDGSTIYNDSDPSAKLGGSLLTVAFQILVNSLPSAKLTVESVETVNKLISCTVQKIKAALRCDA